jgi:hypothetical protein
MIEHVAPASNLSRFTGDCEYLTKIDVRQVTWIGHLDAAAWPENWLCHGRPYVLVEPDWQDWSAKTNRIVAKLLKFFPGCREAFRCLTTVHPGEYVPPHVDAQPPEWITRIHVPLVTNPKAEFIVNDVSHHLKVGSAYKINPEQPHAIRNGGDASRIHLMFDVMR